MSIVCLHCGTEIPLSSNKCSCCGREVNLVPKETTNESDEEKKRKTDLRKISARQERFI